MIKSTIRRKHDTPQLTHLFERALETVQERRGEINRLDDYNHNHGDNLTRTFRTIVDVLQAHQGEAPAEALRQAGRRLEGAEYGSTSRHYATGLRQAADKLSGDRELEDDDVLELIQTLFGAIPAEYEGQRDVHSDSVLRRLLGEGPTPTEEDVGLDDVLGLALPAGLSYLRSRQAGEDNSTAVKRALMRALLGGRTTQGDAYRVAGARSLGESLLRGLLGG
jgi:hypothetical protein